MAVEFKDYYAILGVPRTADSTAIRRAYRKLARQYHPDVNPQRKQEAEARFKEINEAYEVLSDPEKRRRYDELGAHWQDVEYGGSPYGAEPGASPFGSGGTRVEFRTGSPDDLGDLGDLGSLFGGGSDFSDFFVRFFGDDRNGGRRAGAWPRGARAAQADAYILDMTLAEAYTGVTKTLAVAGPDGQRRTFNVSIPAGIDDGTVLRVTPASGQAEADGSPLLLRVRIRPDPRFERQGADLRTRVEVPLTVAVEGGEVPVPLPDGKRVLLHIPPETQPGRVFRLRGKGMPLGTRAGRGSLYVEASIRLPEHLTDRQRQAFAEFARTLGA